MRPEEREKYRLHARLPIYARHVEAARRNVHDALASVEGLWAVGCSGGKDSLALAHFAHAAGWRGPLFHFYFEETPPENTALVFQLGERLGCDVIAALIPGDFDTLRRFGSFFLVPDSVEQRAAVADGERRYKAAAEKAAIDAGLTGLFWGMRAEESRNRAIVLAKHGALYRAKTRETWTSCPLARWSARDVWAYTIAHDLPWLPVYDVSDDRERERSETTWLAFPELWRRGQGIKMRERSPEQWARLCQRWPELRRFG